jgi:hypothetical protein
VSDMTVLLIRCLESELYASIVALSMIFYACPPGPLIKHSFDTVHGVTCSLEHNP